MHTSNYRIIGYTRETTLEELAELKEETGLPVIQDLGSGVLVDLGKYGLAREPMVQESVRSGADVVSFSGDKLLGGPQAGIIVGKKKYIEKMKRHPLARALRIDKFTAAALEAVFRQYLDPEKAAEKIPVLRMLTRRLRRYAPMRKTWRNGCGLPYAKMPRTEQKEPGLRWKSVFPGQGAAHFRSRISQAMRWQWIPRISRPANWRRD